MTFFSTENLFSSGSKYSSLLNNLLTIRWMFMTWFLCICTFCYTNHLLSARLNLTLENESISSMLFKTDENNLTPFYCNYIIQKAIYVCFNQLTLVRLRNNSVSKKLIIIWICAMKSKPALQNQMISIYPFLKLPWITELPLLKKCSTKPFHK